MPVLLPVTLITNTPDGLRLMVANRTGLKTRRGSLYKKPFRRGVHPDVGNRKHCVLPGVN